MVLPQSLANMKSYFKVTPLCPGKKKIGYITTRSLYNQKTLEKFSLIAGLEKLFFNSRHVRMIYPIQNEIVEIHRLTNFLGVPCPLLSIKRTCATSSSGKKQQIRGST